MKTETTRDIGHQGEDLAVNVLTAKGYAIIDRNVIIGHAEIDILALKGNRIVIVEVKQRKDDHLDDNYGLDREKIRRLSRAGDSYVRARNLPHEVQIDAVLITTHADGTADIEHIEDLALPPMRRWR